MIRSLSLYSKNVLQVALNGNFEYIARDIRRYLNAGNVFREIPSCNDENRLGALNETIQWLIHSQEQTPDGGMGSFHLATGWGSSYPETTGYIVSTLLNYSQRYQDEKARESAMRAVHFLLKIQRPSGGWQGGRMNENKPEIVFNTGQVLRGMLSAYEMNGDEKYLDAGRRGADWLCSIQDSEGYWKRHALMERFRVYDAFVDVPLLRLFQVTGEVRYRDTALKNLHWITERKMQLNGWFQDCDNTVKRNDKPILHTIAYTLDGLIESDEILQDGRFVQSARVGADELKRQLFETGRLSGRYDSNWKGSEYFLCTGAAQMAIVWMRLYRITAEKSYLEAADRTIDILLYILQRGPSEKPDTKGAVPGSFPIWGRYEPFAMPNWASKFFADALLLRMEIKE